MKNRGWSRRVGLEGYPDRREFVSQRRCPKPMCSYYLETQHAACILESDKFSLNFFPSLHLLWGMLMKVKWENGWCISNSIWHQQVFINLERSEDVYVCVSERSPWVYLCKTEDLPYLIWTIHLQFVPPEPLVTPHLQLGVLGAWPVWTLTESSLADVWLGPQQRTS